MNTLPDVKNFIRVEVLSTSLNFNHLSNLNSQLRGVERQLVGKFLADIKPLNQRKSDVIFLKKSSFELEDCVKSDVVYRKIRTEQLAKNDRDKDDITDLMKLQKDHPE